jgi:hypothetical protein
VFRLTEHIERLFNSAQILMMEIPYTVDELVAATKETVRASGLPSCYIRPIAYYGYGEMGLNTLPCSVDVAIACWPWGAYLGDDAVSKGVRMKISSWARHDHNVMPPASKTTGNYVNSSLAKVEAIKAGYDEAVMLNPDGYVSECTCARSHRGRPRPTPTPRAPWLSRRDSAACPDRCRQRSEAARRMRYRSRGGANVRPARRRAPPHVVASPGRRYVANQATAMSISIRTTLVVVTAALGLSTDSIAQEPMPTEPAATADPNLWLEDVLGDKALDWVRARNADSRKELTAGETFGKLEQRILSILDSTARIPFASKRGEHYYNLWQDAANPRGLWRRTTLE